MNQDPSGYFDEIYKWFRILELVFMRGCYPFCSKNKLRTPSDRTYKDGIQLE